MDTNNNFLLNWATFFEEYAGDFSDSFKMELAKQLLAKGESKFEIRSFEKYDFQILVGQVDLKKRLQGNSIYATITFCTPSAYSFDVDIYWTIQEGNVTNVHTESISGKEIEFNWAENFPVNELFQYIKPYRKEKKDKTNLNLDVEYYYNAFPDILLGLELTPTADTNSLDIVYEAMTQFKNEWNKNYVDRPIEYISELIKKGQDKYEAVIDFGDKNNPNIVSKLIKQVSQKVGENIIRRVIVK